MNWHLLRVLAIRAHLVLGVALAVLGLNPENARGQQAPRKIAEGVFLIPGLGSNVVAVTGSGGVLLIDNGHARYADSLNARVGALGSGPVRIAIGTHFHFDHVGANEALARGGATLVGHANTRKRMTAEWVIPDTLGIHYAPVPPSPEVALPVVTFDRALTLHFDGHDIDAVYLPNAHSDTDVAVFIRDLNVLHAGDLYLSNGFPVLDPWHGASIDGLLSALDELIRLVDDRTIIVPGHGPVRDRAGLQAYRAMLAQGKERIAALVSQGRTLEEVVAANPTAGLYTGGKSWLDPKLFVWSVYVDLTRRAGGASLRPDAIVRAASIPIATNRSGRAYGRPRAPSNQGNGLSEPSHIGLSLPPTGGRCIPPNS